MQNVIDNFTIHHFKEASSTNDLAFDLIKNNQAFDHHIIVANKQTSGRGRYGRSWLSYDGNLYLSLIIKISNIHRICDYSLLTACVLGSTLKHFRIYTKYKWPNDIIFEDKKLAGILLQSQIINKTNYLIIGIGVNLNDAPDYAISLKNFNIKKEDLIEKLAVFYDKYLENYKNFGFLSIKNEWKDNAYKIYENIKLSNGKEGIFQDIDSDGNLILKNINGKIEKILSEEVFI